MGWASLIFGDDQKIIFESQFRRLREVNFSPRQADGKIFKKLHKSIYYVSDSQKNSLPNLTHGFHIILLQLGTNCQKICLVLRLTSVFNVFVKTEGGGAKFLFLIFLLNVTTKGSLLI